MPRHHSILVAGIAALAATVPAHGQSLPYGQMPSGGEDAPARGGAGDSALRDAGVLCVFDPAAPRKLREARILADPATGDTFASIRPSGRPLPLGLLFPARRSYVTARPWFGSDAPLVFAGRSFQRHGGPVVLPMGEMRPVGTTADIWLFARVPATEPGVLYAPSGHGCEFQSYRAVSPPVRGTRASRGLPPRHRVLGYLTDRAATGDMRPGRRYGAEQGPLEEGAAVVAITPRHRLGRIESRRLIGGGTDGRSHVVLSRLQDPASRVPAARALLFIHGFNNSFDDAARRAAQLAEDLDFDGDVYFFSWPSRAKLVSYIPDETMMQRARGDFAEVVRRLLERHGAGNVSVITHSMGSCGFAQAVRDVQPGHPGEKLFDHVVLASSDQDFVVFRDQEAGPLVAAANRVTVYSSPADRALRASNGLHRGARTGNTPQRLGEVPGIDVIDTSASSGGFLRHSDYAERPPVLGDLYLLLRGRTPAQRTLVRVDSAGSTYWKFE